TFATNWTIAAFTGPPFHEGSGSSSAAPAAGRSAIAAIERRIKTAVRNGISDPRGIEVKSARRNAELFHEVDLPELAPVVLAHPSSAFACRGDSSTGRIVVESPRACNETPVQSSRNQGCNGARPGGRFWGVVRLHIDR